MNAKLSGIVNEFLQCGTAVLPCGAVLSQPLVPAFELEDKPTMDIYWDGSSPIFAMLLMTAGTDPDVAYREAREAGIVIAWEAFAERRVPEGGDVVRIARLHADEPPPAPPVRTTVERSRPCAKRRGG